jgi:serine/threonine protein kinase
MLQKEYNLLKRLADDNIIKVYDFTEDESKNEAYLIMEYFTGINLDEYIEENGVLTEKESAIVLYQILSSVQYLHELGIAHRDIKPENILINEDKEIKLIDFNISKARNSEVIS